MPETVFIGVPTLDRPRYVRETVESILAQTYRDFRVVVSDNCSGPGVAEATEEFIAGLGDGRVTFYRQPVNGGEYGQGRFFFAAAAGHRYFMILHDDDVVAPGYLDKAVAALDGRPELAFFVANPSLMDGEGRVSREDTERYIASSGRKGRPDGEIDVLSSHIFTGFTPISGTVFRTAALADSGFVDDDCHGNFPFECNVFLRLGERGARAWFCSDELLSFRFHKESLRNYLSLMDNPDVVDTMLRIFERRRFTGRNELRRRVVLSRLHRARALIRVRKGDLPGARRDAVAAVRTNPLSHKGWAVLPFVALAPGALIRFLPELPETRERPVLQGGAASIPQ